MLAWGVADAPHRHMLWEAWGMGDALGSIGDALGGMRDALGGIWDGGCSGKHML